MEEGPQTSSETPDASLPEVKASSTSAESRPKSQDEGEPEAPADSDSSSGKPRVEAEAAAGSEGGTASSETESTGDAASEQGAGSKGEASPADSPDGSRSESKADGTKKSSGGSRWWYLLLLILVVEFWVYGRQGEIEVCVGKQGTHDFALLGQERTDDNRWAFPRCETRENLGLRSNYDLLVEDAIKNACRGQTMLRHRGEGPACVEQNDGWQHQLETSFIPPWDHRYYEHLLWFLF